MIWLIPGPLPSTTLDLTRLLTFFVTLVLRGKKVSIIIVSVDSSHVHFGFSAKCFPLAKMTTKFNKDMYAKMRSKEDEPLLNLGKKAVRVTGKGPSVNPPCSVTPIVSTIETTRTASPTTSIEEIPTLGSKRPCVADKEEKVDSQSSTIWDDKRLAVDRAHEVVTPADLRALSDMSLNEVASRHVHRLVQVWCSPFFFFFFY